MPAYMRVSVLADQLLLSHDEEGQKFDFPLSLSFSQGLSLPPSCFLRRRHIINGLIDVEPSDSKLP